MRGRTVELRAAGAMAVVVVGACLAFAGCEKESRTHMTPTAVTPAPVVTPPPAPMPAPTPPPTEAAAPGAAGVAPGAASAESGEPAGPVKPGAEAPDFTLSDLDGKPVTLSGLRGKTVVLEWYNPDCPFVRYAHTEGSLSGLAARHMADGVVWLAINSGAPGKQGHGKERNAASLTEYGLTHPVLLDEDGKVGRLYGATRTPQFWIVDAKGKVAYAGALDNAPLGQVSGDGELVDYVSAALADLAAGREVAMPVTKPYGCSVKYAER
ncbi:MAG: redoxin family protein [Deltaproteobacteria bacterium]|nr:redoxin family protein [Deltaproteobacteria bacterium]